MKRLSILLLLSALAVSPLQSFSQVKADEKKVEPKKETTTKAKKDEKKDDSKTKSSSKSGKQDSQTQEEFFSPDKSQKSYNYYDRKTISTPLQAKLDQPNATYQKGKTKEKQQKAYIARKYYFPARPKDQWELGINFGNHMISGDVKPKTNPYNPIENIGVGITARKSLGYVFSIRFGYHYGRSTGRNWEGDQNLKYNKALNGSFDSTLNYYSNTSLLAANTDEGLNMNGKFWYNYQTQVHAINVEGVFTLGNINFHRERSIANVYAYLGFTAMFARTKMDALDGEGNEYDFSSAYKIFTDYVQSGGKGAADVNSRRGIRQEMYKSLDGIFDGDYESDADREVNVWGINDYQLIPSATVGFGIQFHVSKWVTLGLDQRMIITGNDVLDGYRWTQDAYPGLTRDYDNVSYTSIQVLIHLGKNRVEPLHWNNPLAFAYQKLGDVDAKNNTDDLLKDTDEDGVPDKLDKEPNTEKGAPVDAHGVTLDSDKDKIPDHKDKEPFSPPGYPVDKDGVAIIPPNPCCDQAKKDGEKGGAGASGYDCSKIDLPGIYFEDDKYYVSPEYYANLHQIAERMQLCPDVKMVVAGNDESTANPKYNEQLAWNRVNQSVDYLVQKYGISRDRFIVKFTGSKKSTVAQTEFEKKKTRRVEFRYANDGENGSSNPPAPHPGLKAGSDK